MTHKDVWKAFEDVLPTYANEVTEFFPNGKNSIRVRLGASHRDFVFTFNSKDEWSFETIERFIKRIFKQKGEK